MTQYSFYIKVILRKNVLYMYIYYLIQTANVYINSGYHFIFWPHWVVTEGWQLRENQALECIGPNSFFHNTPKFVPMITDYWHLVRSNLPLSPNTSRACFPAGDKRTEELLTSDSRNILSSQTLSKSWANSSFWPVIDPWKISKEGQ